MRRERSMHKQYHAPSHRRCSTRCFASKINKKKRSISIERSQPGPSVDLQCSQFPTCSGCTLALDLHNPPILKTAKEFFRKLGEEDFRLHADEVHGWRCRVKLAVRGTSKRPIIGLFKKGSHDAISIPACRVHHPAINQAVDCIAQLVKALGIPPYDDTNRTGVLRYVQLTVVPKQRLPITDRNQVQVQVVLVVAAAPSTTPPPSSAVQLSRALAEQLWLLGGPGPLNKSPLFHSIWLNFQPSPTSNAVLGADWQLLHGPQLMWLDFPTGAAAPPPGSHSAAAPATSASLPAAVSVAFLPGSFIQSNYNAAARCIQSVCRQVPPGAAVTELYAGVGALGLAVGVCCSPSRVVLVEVNPQCREPFMAARANLPQGLDIQYTTASAGSNPAQWVGGAEVLIVDPPRRGLDPPVLDLLCNLGPLSHHAPPPSPPAHTAASHEYHSTRAGTAGSWALDTAPPSSHILEIQCHIQAGDASYCGNADGSQAIVTSAASTDSKGSSYMAQTASPATSSTPAGVALRLSTSTAKSSHHPAPFDTNFHDDPEAASGTAPLDETTRTPTASYSVSLARPTSTRPDDCHHTAAALLLTSHSTSTATLVSLSTVACSATATSTTDVTPILEGTLDNPISPVSTFNRLPTAATGNVTSPPQPFKQTVNSSRQKEQEQQQQQDEQRQEPHALCQQPEQHPISSLQRVVYVSCGYEALVRDSQALLESGGWRLQSAEAFLFFPGTNAIESVAVFDRVRL